MVDPPKKLALATNNSHKVRELRQLLEGWEILTPSELGLDGFDPAETGDSFRANALIKAQALFDRIHMPSLADDSGLVVSALGGEPGIYSARYGGKGLTDRERALLVLEKMQGQSFRSARFQASLCYVDPSGSHFFDGIVEGEIGSLYQEGGGFGYDPIFFYPPFQRYFSELSSEEKNSISHRGKALQKFLDFLPGSTNSQSNH